LADPLANCGHAVELCEVFHQVLPSGCGSVGVVHLRRHDGQSSSPPAAYISSRVMGRSQARHHESVPVISTSAQSSRIGKRAEMLASALLSVIGSPFACFLRSSRRSMRSSICSRSFLATRGWAAGGGTPPNVSAFQRSCSARCALSIVGSVTPL